MRIDQQVDMESFLDVRHAAGYIDKHAVGILSSDRQPVRLQKGGYGLIVFLGWAELFRKLRGGQPLAVNLTGGIVQLLQQLKGPVRLCQ